MRLIYTSRLVRTNFWQFPSYELAQHPCIKTFSKLIIEPLLKTKLYNEGYIIIRNTYEGKEGVNRGCFSNVGMISQHTRSGNQRINIGPPCVTQGTMQHEMMHALVKGISMLL